MKSMNIDAVRSVVIRQTADGQGTAAAFEEMPYSSLPDHDVLVKIGYSTLNYKDGMALTGRGIARKLPMIAGIDLVGTVVQSDSPRWKPGDKVIVNGFGLSEKYWGGYSTYQRVKSDWLVMLPPSLSMANAMGIGTAGYTSMLCVMALERAGLKPGGKPVLVTGAAGGVGSIAVALLSGLGYDVTASTGRRETHDYLKFLGAASVIERAELAGKGAPLDSVRWEAAVDCVGGQTLASALSRIKYAGCVAACGMASDTSLHTSVLPFILRAVGLLGVDSVMTPMDLRVTAWERLSKELPLKKLEQITTVHEFDRILELAPEILNGQIRGRIALKIDGLAVD